MKAPLEEEFILRFPEGPRTTKGFRLSANFFMHKHDITGQNRISHIGSGFAVPRAVPNNFTSAKLLADDLEKIFDWSTVKPTKAGNSVTNKKKFQALAPQIKEIYAKRGVPA